MEFCVNKNWKNIAKGHTAFCIFGGPSSNQVKDINKIIENNFTVTVNHNIKRFPNASMFVTADNPIAREYFEDKEFFLHKFEGGKLLRNQSQFNFNSDPIWVKGKRDIISQNPDLIKIIACIDSVCYNTNFSCGQLYKYKGIEYAKEVKNTHICLERRDKNNEAYPILSPSIPESLIEYGKDPLNLMPGGNIASVALQILYYMGFDKVIIVGYGDKGETQGYEDVEYFAGADKNSSVKSDNKVWSWSEPELHAMVVHQHVWGDRIKLLHGGEVCKEYAHYKDATYSDLENNNKKELIDKLIKL